LGDIGKDVEYSTNGVDRDRALAVGLVESGKWDRAIKEIEKLKSIYYYDYFNSQADSYIKAVRQLERRGLCPKDKNFYFAIGDTYIENQLFGEARSFFTKRILDYGVDLRELLRYLKNKYFAQKDIVQKVWGDEIYVTLEDFEELDTKIYNWVSTNKARIISHYIDDKTYHKGLRSEWFDLYYSQENKLGDYNYLAKTVSILVFDYDFKLGIRLFIKSIVPFEYIVGVNMVRQGPGLIASGIYTSTQSRALDNGWVEYRIDNLSGGVRKIFPATKGNVLEIKIDKVAIDSKCASNKFFVDDIEIFIMND
jgi:hypothetical protein